ncbi:MAG: phenylalanine--tRNA ligase subunit alpha, partial [Bacillota bacterium]|nr:phenylalanine--tRNA ligase subunit alpha [Bacillota bacterium]
MIDKLKSVMQEALSKAEAINSLEDAEDLRIKILGKKGSLTDLMKGMKDLAPEQRKEFGAAANKARNEIETKI